MGAGLPRGSARSHRMRCTNPLQQTLHEAQATKRNAKTYRDLRRESRKRSDLWMASATKNVDQSRADMAEAWKEVLGQRKHLRDTLARALEPKEIHEIANYLVAARFALEKEQL